MNSDESIFAAAKKLEADFGYIDVLVNNAGIAVDYEFGKPGLRDILRKQFETNVFGLMVLSEALIPLLKKSKDPRIVNVSSGLGSISLRTKSDIPYYGVTSDPYRMTKSAVNMLTQCQNYHMREFGGKSWAFCPGYVVTDLTGEADRENRIKNGALSPEVSARGIKEIVEGKRDEEFLQFVTISEMGGKYGW